MAEKYTFRDLELNPLKQFLFPPSEDAQMVLEKESYRERIISILLHAEDRLNAGIVLQHNDGKCEIIEKLDVTSKEWSFAKDRIYSPEIPIAIIPVPEERKNIKRKEALKLLLKPLDYYAVLIEQGSGCWEVSFVPPYHEFSIELGEEEFDYFAQCAHYTTKMPKVDPIKAQEWRQTFTYNGINFVLVASRTPDKLTNYDLEIERYAIGKSFVFGLTEESEEDVLKRIEWLIYELFRKNPRISHLGIAINNLFEQVERNGHDGDIIDKFVEYGTTDGEYDDCICVCYHDGEMCEDCQSND